MRHKYVLIVAGLLLGIFVIARGCTSYFENKYKIKSANVKLFDFVGEDSLGCSEIISFSASRSNEWCGIALVIQKELYADKTVQGGFNKTMARGFNGAGDSITELKIFLQDSLNNQSIDITNLVKADSSHLYISRKNATADTYSISDKGCIYSPFFQDINTFVSVYNAHNSEALFGEHPQEEIIFCIRKDIILRKTAFPKAKCSIKTIENQHFSLGK